MKNVTKIFKATCLMGVAALATTSCQDWLTVYPQTQVVEENFWEDKTDLEGVRYATYKQMCSTLDKMVLWGDLRSDSYTLSSADTETGTAQLYQEIRDGKIDRDSASTYFDWSGFYTTINYCNKVLQHGAEVLDKDKQFTTAEWNQMKAEITALRALNYFYLIRSFKDVPYSTKVVNNDTQVQSFGATNQLVVLDSLITDLESVKGRARNRFTNIRDTKGMITNSAIYAMLSDMYLWRASLHQGRWGLESADTFTINSIPGRMGELSAHSVRGDYQLCIDYADLALKSLADQTEENNKGFGNSVDEVVNYGLQNCNMYKNKFDNFINGATPRLYAYSSIFSQGNSDESIFELQFNASDSRKNTVVTSQWGYGDKVHLAISQGALGAIYTDDALRSRDSRVWFSAWDKVLGQSQNLPGLYCFKWSGITPQITESKKCSDLKITRSDNEYCNWIIYRMSDMMLQKAEALVAIGQDNEAMRYVNAIHRRWYCNDDRSVTSQPVENVMNADGTKPAGTTAGTMGNYPTAATKEIAVMNERQLEFFGEGKRWFDLVRFAERNAGGKNGTQDPREWTEEDQIGNGKAGVDMMVDKFLRNEFNNSYATLKNRFKNRYGLYNIIYYMEIKASEGKLEQNPVWNKSTYDQ